MCPTFAQQFHPLQFETNRAVLAAAEQTGHKVYLVGGYVRDALLNRFGETRHPKDFDYMVMNGSALGLARQAQQKLGGHFVLLDEANDTARLVFDNGEQVDFAGCVGGTVDSDMHRRDFSINALCWDPATPDQIIDLVGGLPDLESRTVRAISEKAFHDDPLRVLRAYRFAAALNFEIDGATKILVKNYAALLPQVAAERITYEFFMIMDTPRAAETVRRMGESGVLELIFPEISLQHRVPPNAYHHLPLYEHTLEVMAQTEAGIVDLPEWARESFDAPLSHTNRFAATKVAALLHDIGKPDTWQVLDDGKHTFIGHDKLGAEMCGKIGARLKWSRSLEKFISNLVRWHLRPGALFHQGLPTERAVHRFYRTIGDEVPQLVLLALGDFRGTCGPGLKEGRQLLENQLRELLDGYRVFIEGRKQTPRLLDGADVMRLLEIQPGPIVGELLDELEEAQGLQEIKDKQQAEAFVRDRYKQKYSK